MLLTLRTLEPPEGGFARAPGDHPGAVRVAELPGGRAHLFHTGPDAAAVLLEPDPGGLPFPEGVAFPPAALLAAALGPLLAPALAADDGAPRAVEARVDVLASPGGEAPFARLFEPLGYAVETERHLLDPGQPRARESWLFSVALRGRQRLGELLSHLRVLLPLFGSVELPGLGEAEAAAAGEEAHGWIADHPSRDLLERRLLRRPLRSGLHDQRHDAVLAALRKSGARRVLDLGCGTGALLRRLLEEPQLQEVVGVEVSRGALAEAAAGLAPDGRGRVLHGSLVYRDARLAGFDAAALVEVIEHLDPPQLAACEDVVWGAARPATVVVTTPNADYNALFEYHRGGRLRHPGHRFEWTRAEFGEWGRGVAARHGYAVRFGAVGPADPGRGAITQMAVFERLAAAAAPAPGGAELAGPTPPTALRLEEVAGGRTISTRLGGPVSVSAGEAAAALERMSGFGVDPRWLVYLPPTTPAAETPPGTQPPEHPSAALAYYRARGAAGVALEELHAGTRVAVVVCRGGDAARRRFRAAPGETGAVYSAAGRPFFAARAAEEAFLARLRGALDLAGTWDELATDWLALEGVIGPGVPLMREVAPQVVPAPALYWAAAAAGRVALKAAEEALARAVAGGVEAAELLARTRERAGRVWAYAEACRHACRPVYAPGELRLAPFRLLAGEGAVHAARDPRWHRERLAPAVGAAPETLLATEQAVVDLADPAGEAAAAARWNAAVARRSPGIVVRPLEPAPPGADAPALKCRAPEALGFVHGPEHALAAVRERVRGRGLDREGARAAREWALSVEALGRFVRGEPAARVHGCVFAALGVKHGGRP